MKFRWKQLRLHVSKGLVRRVLSFVLFLAIVATALMGGLAYALSYERLRASVFAQLELTARLKEDELQRWLTAQRQQVALVASVRPVREMVTALVQSPPESSVYQTAHEDLARYLSSTVVRRAGIIEIFILSAENGRVLVSSNATRVGTDESMARYFVMGREMQFIQKAYRAGDNAELRMTIAMPMVDMSGERSAVLAAHVDLERMHEIVRLRSGFGISGESYLVDTSRRIVYMGQVGAEERALVTVDTVGVTAALAREDGVAIYPNVSGTLVAGAYTWLQDFDLVMLTEVPVAIAIRGPAQQVMFWVVSVGVVMLVAIGVGTYVLLQRAVRPLAELTERVQDMAQGNLEQSLVVESADEVGALAGAFNQMSQQLRGLYTALESTVNARTVALAQRSQQFEAAAQVSRAAAAIRDVEVLLEETVRLISEYFGYYHAGIFFVDETGQYAVLQAASSEGGRRMLARGHKLAVGYGIVGAVVATGAPRIALDVGDDPIYFDNPDLPQTRSEMGLPLKVRDRLIGVLDVQSAEAAAFSDEDIAVLQTMADQVALAIQNARLIQESAQAVQELERRYGEQVQMVWQERLARQRFAFHYDQVRVAEAPEERDADFAVVVPDAPAVHELPEGGRRLVAPIRVRNQVLGSVVLEQEAGARPWAVNELALVGAVCDQIGQALNNASLLDQSEVRAERERLSGEIAATVRAAATDMDSVLQTTLRELGLALRASGYIQLTGVQSAAGERRA